MTTSLATQTAEQAERSRTSPRVVAYALVAAFTAIVLWFAAQGFMLLDDYELQSLAYAAPGLDWSYLTQPWGGHFMPSGFALAQLLAKTTPFTYVPMVALMGFGMGAFALALARLLFYVLGNRWLALLPLALIMASGAIWDSVTWWIAALNSIPLLIAIPLATYMHLRWLQEGSLRSGILAWAITVVACTFFEKALGLVFFLGLLTIALRGRWNPPRSVRAVWGLLVLYAVTVAGFAYAYLSSSTGQAANIPSVQTYMDFIGAGALTFPPLLLGGPWSWSVPAVASTPVWLSVASGNVLLFVALSQGIRSRRAALLWGGLLVYLLAIISVIAVGRAGWGVQVISQPRYFVDAVVYTIVAASIAAAYLCPSNPAPNIGGPRRQAWSILGAFIAVQAVTVSGMLTLPYLSTSLLANPSRNYVIGSIESLRNDSAVVNNGLLPGDVLWPLVSPANQIRPFFAPIFDIERFPDSRNSLDVINAFGAIRPGQVVDDAARKDVEPCPVRIAESNTSVMLPRPLPDYWHTLTFASLADGPTSLEVSLGDGAPVRVDLLPGLNQSFVFLGGSGDRLSFTRVPDGVNACLSDIAVGFTAEASP